MGSSERAVPRLLAMLFAIDPTLTGAEARKLLVDSADAIGDSTISGKRLNAHKAVKLALERPYARLRADKGDCRDEFDTPCPSGTVCTFCIDQASMEYTGHPGAGTHTGLTGSINLEGLSPTFNFSGGVSKEMTSSSTLNATFRGSQLNATVSKTRVDVNIPSGGRFDHWTYNVYNPPPGIFVSSDCSTAFSATFSGGIATGTYTLTETSTGNTAKVNFTGRIWVSDGGVLPCVT